MLCLNFLLIHGILEGQNGLTYCNNLVLKSNNYFESIAELRFCDKTINIQFIHYNSSITYTSSFGVNQLNGVSLSFAGRLVVDSDITFKDCNLKFNSSGEVKVTSSRSLILDNTGLFSCTDMWRGIKMDPSSNIILKNATVIEDAMVGLRMNSQTTINCTNTSFKNCNVGIHFPGSGNDCVPIDNVTLSDFIGNRFVCLHNLRPPLADQKISFAGMVINCLGGFKYFGMHNSSKNLFENLQVGVISNNSYTFLLNFVMKNIRGLTDMYYFDNQGYPTGIGVYVGGKNGSTTVQGNGLIWNDNKSSFINCDISGIYFNESDGYVNYTGFEGTGYTDIYTNSSQLGPIVRTAHYVNHDLTKPNSIACYSRGQARDMYIGQLQNLNYKGSGTKGYVFDDLFNGAANAIYALNSAHQVMDNNTNCIEYNGTGKTHPIYIEDNDITISSGQGNNKVYFNFSNNKNDPFLYPGLLSNWIQTSDVKGDAGYRSFSTAFKFLDIWNLGGCNNTTNNIKYGFLFQNYNPNWYMGETSFGYHDIGLYLQGSTVITGTKNINRGNKWLDTFTDPNAYLVYAAKNENTSNYLSSLIKVHSALNIMFPPLRTPFDWFTYNAGQKKECNLGFANNNEEYAYYDSQDTIVANGGVGILSEYILKERQIDLYNKIKHAPISESGNAMFQNYFSNNQTTNIGKLADLTEKMVNLVDVHPQAKATLYEIQNQRSLALKNLLYQDSLYQAANVSQSVYNNPQRASNIQQYFSLSNSIQQIIDIAKIDVSLKIGNFKNELSNLTINDEYNTMLKTVWQANIQCYENSGYANDTMNIHLLSIAEKCPLVYGSVVQTARTILPHCMRDTSWNNLVNCEIQYIESREAASNSEMLNEIRLYPNPANSHIAIKGLNDLNAQIEILDLNGNKIISKQIVNGLDIDISSLCNGLYLVRIKSDKQNKTIKLIKL